MLEKKYPYYLANKAQTSKAWMDVLDKYSGKVATRVAVPDASPCRTPRRPNRRSPPQ